MSINRIRKLWYWIESVCVLKKNTEWIRDDSNLISMIAWIEMEMSGYGDHLFFDLPLDSQIANRIPTLGSSFFCVSWLWTTRIANRFWKKRRMRRFAVRQRPLQPGKRIRVYHLAVDGSFINENGDRVPANLYDLDDCVSSCSDHHFGVYKRLQVFELQF